MTADLQTLRGLLERVRAADGPDVQLDNDICRVLQADPAFVSHSLDASVGLVGAALGGATSLRILLDPAGAEVSLAWFQDGLSGGYITGIPQMATSVPLAILGSLLSALIARAEAAAHQQEETAR
jgi:hypothetical protein